jgi:hypothetical protein
LFCFVFPSSCFLFDIIVCCMQNLNSYCKICLWALFYHESPIIRAYK